MITVPQLSGIRSVRHGFFGRIGGVSQGIYESCNVGLGSRDDRDHVLENRRRVAEAMAAPPEHLLTLYQVHSAEVVTVRNADDPKGREADGMVTDRPGFALGVLTADCAPVLFADPGAGVIGAAHAGWGGAFRGVLEATVDAMEALSARRESVVAVVGPSIAQHSYEVGPEFLERFETADAANTVFFKPSTREGHHQFDLPGYVLARLRQAGVVNVSWTGHDTCGDAERFFSYRRSVLKGEPDYGRQVACITLAQDGG
jgi:YfiH family protein